MEIILVIVVIALAIFVIIRNAIGEEHPQVVLPAPLPHASRRNLPIPQSKLRSESELLTQGALPTLDEVE
jgi:hypothetical protein